MAKEENRITDLKSYINLIEDLRKKYLYDIDLNDNIDEITYKDYLSNSSNRVMYFRGQSNSEWPIYPNVFRNNMLSKEYEMIERAFLNNPEIEREYKTPFERLTVLQHYELGTRLLDITKNAFVALYFACQPSKIEKEFDIDTDVFKNTSYENLVSLEDYNKICFTKEADGIVFFKCEYSHSFNTKEVQILSYVAQKNFDKNYKIEDLLDEVLEKNFINKKEYEKYKEENYKKFIKLLQQSFFVESNISNDRLNRQSGAFLLSGCINVKKIDNEIFYIEKSTTSLNNKFEDFHIIIDAESKKSILNELDNYNINEKTLFPELEHQLKYIQNKCKENCSSISQFELYNFEDEEILNINNNKIEEDIEQINLFEFSEEDIEKYKSIVEKYMTTDWEKKEVEKSSIKQTLKRHLIKNENLDKNTATIKSMKILDELIKYE